MKKRLISILALALLCAMLLCSCAEGLPLCELALAAKDKIGTLTSRVENLLKDNPPLAANGKTDFAVAFDATASHTVQSAVADFCARFQAYSGADLTKNDPQSAKRRIVIGLADTDAAKEVLKGLSAASFYIGFAENDLLILAQNDVMLCEALAYFADTYLNKDATPNGTKDVFWPSGLHYTSPTLLCEDDEYTILRAEQAGDGVTEAVSLLYETIHAQSGARPLRKTDFNYKGSEKEILLGYPDHPLANEILATLSRDEYYIGVRGKTIMILAQNDLMLQKAVTRFIADFVSTRSAAIDKKSKQISFPATCDFYYRENSILLAEDGVNHAVLVYPAGVGSLTRTAINNLCALYKQLTNTELTAYADNKYERVEGVFEILVGRTARSESAKLYFDGIAKGEWHVAMDEGGEALVIGANGEFALKAAVEAFGNALITHTALLSRKSIYNDWQIKTGVDRLLYLFADTAQSGSAVPDLPGTFTYKLYTYSYQMTQKKSSASAYETYCEILDGAKFTLVDHNKNDGVYRASYQDDTQNVTVTYKDSTQTLTVQVSTRRWR